MSKYEKAKESARTWYLLFQEAKENLENAENEIRKLRSDVERWKKLSEQLPDPSIVQDLEQENRKIIKSLKKQLYETEEKYKDKVAKLEREKILYEGKNQQLEEARKDLQERYSELKQDYREQQRWARKEN
jgi:DNA repair exonuclease SbcCD ATPase subunit